MEEHREGDGMDNTQELIPVESIAQERQYIESQKCTCGGPYRKTMQALFPDRPADLIEASCAECGSTKQFWFDISSFFGK